MVVSVAAQVRLFLASDPTDMRKSFDGLCAIVQHEFGRDPFNGDIFVFLNRRRDRVKLLLWDGNGFWVLAKRLEQGTFEVCAVGDDGARYAEIDRATLTMLLEGIEMKSAKLRNHFARSVRIGGRDGRSHHEDRRRSAR